jgi:hypothetical protein
VFRDRLESPHPAMGAFDLGLHDCRSRSCHATPRFSDSRSRSVVRNPGSFVHRSRRCVSQSRQRITKLGRRSWQPHHGSRQS